MYLLVSCQYVHVCVAITRLLLQKCLSMKCRYVHVSVCILMYLHVSACICMYLQIMKHWHLLWQWLWAVFMTMWACNLGCVLEPGEPRPDSPLFYINTWAMVWPNDYPALATWNVHGNKTDPVWTCLGWPASVSPYTPNQLQLQIQLSYREYWQIDVTYWQIDSIWCRACHFLHIAHT